MGFSNDIKHERPCLTTIPNTERVENTSNDGVFLTNLNETYTKEKSEK